MELWKMKWCCCDDCGNLTAAPLLALVSLGVLVLMLGRTQELLLECALKAVRVKVLLGQRDISISKSNSRHFVAQ